MSRAGRLAAFQETDEARRGFDEGRIGAHRRDAFVAGHAALLGEIAHGLVQLHLDVSTCSDTKEIGATINGTPSLPARWISASRRRADPLRGADAALITNRPIRASIFEARHDGGGGPFHLPLIGIAPGDGFFRQAMRRQQDARLFLSRSFPHRRCRSSTPSAR